MKEYQKFIEYGYQGFRLTVKTDINFGYTLLNLSLGKYLASVKITDLNPLDDFSQFERRGEVFGGVKHLRVTYTVRDYNITDKNVGIDIKEEDVYELSEKDISDMFEFLEDRVIGYEKHLPN